MDAAISIAVGLGLAAATGMRVFVPLLITSIAGLTGTIEMASGFDWLATTPAAIALGAATAFEVTGYFIPFFDHVLDTIAAPTAVVAGALASASVIVDLPPELHGLIAIVGGGGTAGVVQGTTTVVRLGSTATTGGLGNPLVALVELIGSSVTSVLAIVVPVLCVVLVAIGVGFALWRFSPGPREGRSPAA
jgi:hypothetical protein